MLCLWTVAGWDPPWPTPVLQRYSDAAPQVRVVWLGSPSQGKGRECDTPTPTEDWNVVVLNPNFGFFHKIFSSNLFFDV